MTGDETAGLAPRRPANARRTAAAAGRDVTIARAVLATGLKDGWPDTWHQVAAARAAYPALPWSQVAAQLGWTKDQAAAAMRRLRRAVDRELEADDA
jgi:hypothetical protein